MHGRNVELGRWSVIAVVGALGVVSTRAEAAADRWGAVWHPSDDPGVFIAGLGQGFSEIQASLDHPLFDGLAITDFEIRSRGCPGDKDEFSVQWHKGDWNEKLIVYPDDWAFADGIQEMCDEGYALHDFELWGGQCEGRTDYVAVFRESDICPAADKPFPAFIDLDSTVDVFEAAAESKYFMVDIELEKPLDPYHTIAVYYAGERLQKLDWGPRAQFEQVMASETEYSLVDFESYRTPDDGEGSDERMVFFLREDLGNDEDHHELGEIFSKFMQLGDKDKYTIVDFEIFADTNDYRYQRAVELEVGGSGGGWALSVMQDGEIVAEAADGWAREALPAVPGTEVAMEPDTRGTPASVTKLLTTLGTLRYAEQQSNPDAWLDEPFVDYLPPDFDDFGAGVDSVTIRELLRQRTGLAIFKPSTDAMTDAVQVRAEMIELLKKPLLDPTKEFEYQNVHFDLIALLMNEVVLPPIVPGPSPWETWMNDEVFTLAGVDDVICGSGPEDALGYPHDAGAFGFEWQDESWDCGGYGTGVGMFWVSATELARIMDATRRGDVVSPDLFAKIISEGQGLDGMADDGDSATIGEAMIFKGGGLCGHGPWGPQMSESIGAWFDDYDGDDVNGADGPFEPALRDMSAGYMLHQSRYVSVCGEEPLYFSWAGGLLQRAWTMPEDW